MPVVSSLLVAIASDPTKREVLRKSDVQLRLGVGLSGLTLNVVPVVGISREGGAVRSTSSTKSAGFDKGSTAGVQLIGIDGGARKLNMVFFANFELSTILAIIRLVEKFETSSKSICVKMKFDRIFCERSAGEFGITADTSVRRLGKSTCFKRMPKLFLEGVNST